MSAMERWLSRVRAWVPVDPNIILNGAHALMGTAFSAVTLMYVSRVLQAEHLGMVSFASSLAGYFALLGGLGIPTYALRSCSEQLDDRTRLRRTVREMIVLGMACAAVAYALLAVVSLAVPALSGLRPALLVLGCGMFFQAVNCQWYFRARGRYPYLTASGFACHLAALVLVVALVRTSGDWLLYCALTLVCPALMAACNLAMARRELAGGPSGKAEQESPSTTTSMQRHLRATFRFFLMSFVVSIYGQLDIVMLGFMASAATVGHYSVAAKIRSVLIAAGGIIWTVNLPSAVRAWQENDLVALQAVTLRGTKLVVLVQALAFALALVCAPGLVELAGGPGYAEATAPLCILALTIPPVALSNIIGGQVLIACNRERSLLAAETAGMVVNLVANALLIPPFGMVGAAWATVAAEVVVCLAAWLAARKALPIRLVDTAWLAKVAAWAAVAGAVAWAVSAACGACGAGSIAQMLAGGVAGTAMYAALFMAYRRGLFRILPNRIAQVTGNAPWRCPCCDGRFRWFARGGFERNPLLYNPSRYAGMRQDVLCPYCGSLPRHRIIATWAERNLDMLKASRILYFAPERSMMTWMRAHGVKVTTADLAAPADLQLDITAIDLPDDCFDVIFCHHVLEHVSDWHAALAELRRVLAPGGTLVICFPIDPTYDTVDERLATSADERVRLFGQHDHLRVFGNDSDELLRSAGFDVGEIDLESMPSNILPVTGPADYDSPRIFLCR